MCIRDRTNYRSSSIKTSGFVSGMLYFVYVLCLSVWIVCRHWLITVQHPSIGYGDHGCNTVVTMKTFDPWNKWPKVSMLQSGCLVNNLIHDMKVQAAWKGPWLGKSIPSRHVAMAMKRMLLTHVIITPSLRFVWSISDFIKILELSNFPICLYCGRAHFALLQYKHMQLAGYQCMNCFRLKQLIHWQPVNHIIL